jgi:hypothetical protein
MLFFAAGTAYFGALWLLSGLSPLPMLISRLRGVRTPWGEFDPAEASKSRVSRRNTAA